MADLRRDFWIRETGTGQQVAQLHYRYMMMMITCDRQTGRHTDRQTNIVVLELRVIQLRNPVSFT